MGQQQEVLLKLLPAATSHIAWLSGAVLGRLEGILHQTSLPFDSLTWNAALVFAAVSRLQVNAVVLCRVVMVTVSSARRRAKMLSPSCASKMQTFDLTW